MIGVTSLDTSPSAVTGGLSSAREFPLCLDDLDIDFEGAPRPVVITRLLAACVTDETGRSFGDGELWRWTLERRLASLVAVAMASLGRTISLTVRCPRDECGETIELDIDLAALQSSPETVISCWPDPTAEVRLRIPTGADQLEWLRLSPQMDLDAVMAASLVVAVNGESHPSSWTLPAEWLNAIGDELVKYDSSLLTAPTVCPACGESVPLAVDVEGKLLSLLSGERRRLLGEIHRIAASYHWSETDIVALPRRRRDYYLKCIDEELIG